VRSLERMEVDPCVQVLVLVPWLSARSTALAFCFRELWSLVWPGVPQKALSVPMESGSSLFTRGFFQCSVRQQSSLRRCWLFSSLGFFLLWAFQYMLRKLNDSLEGQCHINSIPKYLRGLNHSVYNHLSCFDEVNVNKPQKNVLPNQLFAILADWNHPTPCLKALVFLKKSVT